MSVLARSVIESVAHALSGEYGVTVIFRGNECKTNGKTIYLPALPDDVPGTLVETLRGYLDHEVGHVIFTDFDLMKKEIKSNIEHLAFNAVEDVRIELAMEHVWKGCAVNFDRLEDRVDPKLEAAWETMDPIVKIFILFIKVARRGWDSPFVEKYGSEYIPIFDYLADELEAVHSLSNTKDAIDMARRILEAIEHAISETSKGSGEGDEEADEGEVKEVVIKRGKKGEGSSSGKMKFADKVKVRFEEDDDDEDRSSEKPEEKKSKDSEKEERPGIPSKPEEGKEEESKDHDSPSTETEFEIEDEADKKGAGKGGAAETEADPGTEPKTPSSIPSALREAIEKALKTDSGKEIPSASEEISKEASSLKGYRVFTTERDTFCPPPESHGALEEYEKVRTTIGGFIGTLKNQLMRILVSQKRDRWQSGKKAGFINPSALVHVINKTSDNVFRIRKEGQKINTAVSILIDLSGSMGTNKTRVARDTAILMAETLSQINIPFEILGFTGDYDYVVAKAKDEADRKSMERFSRWGSLDMTYYKLFTEPFGQEQRKRLGSMLEVHRCQNYDGESVLFAAKRLLRCTEKKKVLFVLSDGEPYASFCRRDALGPHLHAVVRELERRNDFYVCGFGILTSAPKYFYKNHVLINDVSDLPKVLVENLYRALVLAA